MRTVCLAATVAGGVSRPPGIPRPTLVELAESTHIAALEDSLQDGADKREFLLEEFWHRVEDEGTPLVEEIDGDPDHFAVTFLWRGGPATQNVLVLPNKVADPLDFSRNLMVRVADTDVWHLTLRMRHDWRATYCLSPDEGDGPGGPYGQRDARYWRWLRANGRPDPLNRRAAFPSRRSPNGLSVVELPMAPGQGQADWRPRPGVPAGTLGEYIVRSDLLGAARRVWIYTPHAYDQVIAAEPVPLLVLLDGEMWGPRLGVATLLDNLIADGRVPPLVAVLPDSVDTATRWREMACNETFAEFLTHELLPWVTATWRVTADPARTVLAGQSLGGLASAFTALRAPERFGNVLAQSGSFWWPAAADGDARGSEWLTRQYVTAPRRPVRFHLSAGLKEWALLAANRRMRDALRDKGYAVVYREFNGGHDYLCWRTAFAEGLVDLAAEWR